MKKSILSSAVRSLLSEKLPDDVCESLKEEGFNLKNPTRKTALAIALYKKAVGGDLSAIKELRSALSEETLTSGRTVTIIDDTGNTD